MKKILFVSLALATAFATTPAAKADSFTFDISGGASGSITVSGDPTGVAGETGDYNINTGTGTFIVNGYSFSGTIIANTASSDVSQVSLGPGYGNNSNVSFWYSDVLNPTDLADGYLPGVADPTDPHPSNGVVSGLLFAISGDAGDFSAGNPYLYLAIWDGGVNHPLILDLGDANGDTSTNIVINWPSNSSNDVAATPEPSSLLLMGTGLLLAAGILFWKKAQQGVL